MLAKDRLLHLFFAPPLGESRPEHGDVAACGEKGLVHGQENGREADSRCQKKTDQQRRNEDNRCPNGVDVGSDAAMNLLTEIAAGWNQSSPQPHPGQGQVEERRNADKENDEADQLRMDIVEIAAPES